MSDLTHPLFLELHSSRYLLLHLWLSHHSVTDGLLFSATRTTFLHIHVAAPLTPPTAQVLQGSGSFCLESERGGHVDTMRGRDSESFGHTLLEPRAVLIIEASSYRPAASFPGSAAPPTDHSAQPGSPYPSTKGRWSWGPFTLLPLGGRVGCLAFLPPATWVFSSQQGARKAPRDLARSLSAHASRPCRSLRSRARSCLRKPRLGMMPR